MALQGAEELECLLAHSKPRITKYRAEASKHTLEIDAMLDMLEVRLIEMIPEKE